MSRQSIRWLILVASLQFAGLLPAQQYTVRSIELKGDVADLRIRPLEHLAVRIVARGEMKDSSGKTQEGIVPPNDGRIRLADPQNGGWISKPYRCEESKKENFLRPQSTLGTILGIGDRFVFKDCVLYTAPELPGRYRIEGDLKEFRTSIEVIVESSAPSRRKPERLAFPDERRLDEPYRALAEHYAPVFAQETWFDPKADYITRFDYDGDWDGSNNWENLEDGTSQAYVYYTVVETKTHWFLIYNAFHPRDYSDNCVAGTCHENDNEGLILTVFKDGSQFGSLRLMETLAHNNVYSYRADRRLANGEHDIDGDVILRDGSHPVVFVESGGHGIYSAGHAKSSTYRDSDDAFVNNTGITFIYKGRAERPRHPADRHVGYDLLPIDTHWWPKAIDPQWRERTWDEFYAYEPFGGRPRTPTQQIPGSFLGRTESANKAKPFWGWHDTRTRRRKVINTGQWGLDPAYGASINVRFPREEPFSLDYVHNPYLGVSASSAPGSGTAISRVESDNQRRPASGRTSPNQPSGEVPASAPPAVAETSPAPGILSRTGLVELPSGWRPATEDRGSVDIIVTVDGEARFLVRGDKILFETISGRPAEGGSSEFRGALPPRPQDVRFEQIRGREKLLDFEQPGPDNNFSVRFRINDPRGGPDTYHIRISWRN